MPTRTCIVVSPGTQPPEANSWSGWNKPTTLSRGLTPACLLSSAPSVTRPPCLQTRRKRSTCHLPRSSFVGAVVPGEEPVSPCFSPPQGIDIGDLLPGTALARRCGCLSLIFLSVESGKLAPPIHWLISHRQNNQPLCCLAPASTHPTYPSHVPHFTSFRLNLSPLVPWPLLLNPHPPPPWLVDGQKTYTVKRVCRHSRGQQCLLDWEGYGSEERSWVPARDILDPTVLQDFHKKHRDQPHVKSQGSP